MDSKCKLYDGFLTILHSNVLSAPVWDASVNKYIGFLDIRDLVSFVVFVYDEQMVQDNSRLEDLIVHGVGQFKVKTTDGVTVSYLSRRHKFVTVHESDSLLSVTKLLADAQVHRVPVVDDAGKVINVISQSSIIGLLADKCAEGGTMHDADQALSSFPHLGNAPVLSVLKTESVINTFRLLEKRNLSGIALVDEKGKLVGTTTGKDLGLFLKNPTLAALNRPIFEHLQHIRSELIESKTPCISVEEKDKLSRAVSLLAATRVHRVFVVDNDENYKPIRIISITDIFKFLTQ
uniref:CBS domain-containing protein n=1 Tax=Arcella intermedia TaxID=1963864 RepID=A0A6B2LAX9_9EUKA